MIPTIRGSLLTKRQFLDCRILYMSLSLGFSVQSYTPLSSTSQTLRRNAGLKYTSHLECMTSGAPGKVYPRLTPSTAKTIFSWNSSLPSYNN